MHRGRVPTPSLIGALSWWFAAAAVILLPLFIAGVFAWLLPVLMVVWLINALNRAAPPRK